MAINPVFHTPVVESVIYPRDSVFVNAPLNMSLVKQFYKRQYRAYPDNKGLPSIRFTLLGENNSADWVFRSEQDRDDEYARILDKFSKS